MKLKNIIILGFSFLFLYEFLFSTEIQEQTAFLPLSSTSLQSAQPLFENVAFESSQIPFSLGNNFGYINKDFKTVFSGFSIYSPTIGTKGYVFPTKDREPMVFFSPKGEPLFTLKNTGLPIIFQDYLFLEDESRRSISSVDDQGDLIWTWNADSIITCLSFSSYGIVLGQLNGKVVVISFEGQMLWESYAGGSEIPTIYGCAISQDGKEVVVVSGLNPQRFILFENRKEDFKPIYHTDLATNFRRNVKIDFSPDGQYILMEGETNLNVFLTTDFSWISLKHDQMDYFDFVTDNNLYATLFKGNGDANLTIQEIGKVPLFQSNFPCQIAYLNQVDNLYYLGIDETLVLIERNQL